MKPILDSQEVVRRFNENEAVWRRYLQKRGLRLLPGSSSPFFEEVLDYPDWLETERECRERVYVGKANSMKRSKPRGN
jgi:hypothetical protein